MTCTAGMRHGGTGDTAWSALMVTMGVRTAASPGGAAGSREHPTASVIAAMPANSGARKRPPRLTWA
ncbi:hypothetical protein GCM10025759_31570 [Lysobacter panacisoli]|uniref:Uncharacterized protein n=1 Tax=Lysobacter panacisoli TaxID=1255263 RepID=A0ABP9LNH7_9GAMM